MKKLYPYNTFVYEGVRDSMTPKSDKDIKKKLANLSPMEKIEAGAEYGIDWMVKNVIDDGLLTKKDYNKALSTASFKGHAEIVKLLLDAGADVHSEYDNALVGASKNGHIEVVKMLLDAGSNPHTLGGRPFELAGCNGHKDITRLLIGATNKHTSNDYELLKASTYGNSKLVKYLLDHGANPHMLEDRPLKMANINGHKDVSDLLNKYMDKKVNEGVRDKMTGKTDRLEEWYRQDADEVVRRFEDAFPLIKITEVRVYRTQLLLAIVIEPIKFTEYDKIKEWFVKNTNYIVDGFKKSFNNTIFIDIDKKSLHKTNESVRDKMTPKSKKDILKNIKNTDREDLDLEMVLLSQEYFDDDAEKLAEFVETEIAPDIWTRAMFKENEKYKHFNNKVQRKRIINSIDEDVFTDVIFCLTVDELTKMFDLLYDLNINESLRDKMTPRSKKDVEEAIGDLVPNAKLVKAAENGVIWMVQEALDEGANIHHMNDEAIKMACLKNHVDIVKLLLDNGADVHLENDILIIESSWSVNYEMIKLLLEYGANVNVHGGVVLGSIVELATINKDSMGMKTIKLLLEYGAIPSYYSIDFARAHNRMDIVNLLEKHLTTNESVRSKMTPKSGEDIINVFDNVDGLAKKRLLIKLIRDKFKYTDDFYEFAKFTLGISDWRRITKGLPKRNRDFYELIDKLKKHELNKLFKTLITKDSINESIKDLMTPKSGEEIKKTLGDLSEEEIHNKYLRAIVDGDFGVLDALKNAGYSVNSRNFDKQTPLMFLCGYDLSSPQKVRAFVKLGADMNLKDRNDRTALMNAVDNNKFEIVKELIDLGVDIKKWNQGAKSMIRAVGKEKDYEMIKDLIDSGVDINYLDYNHSTVLIYAALVSRKDLVELLINKGADVNIQNENGNTALMNAARKSDKEIVKMILDAGADVTLKNFGNQTAYDVAINYRLNDNAELILRHEMTNESNTTTDPKIGKSFWFEYHCLESPSSADAKVWYHSHQRVKVLSRGKDDHDEFPDEPKTYIVQFEDGLIWDVFDDELMDSKEEFYRPDPPLKESLRDKMTPKSDEDIYRAASKLTPDELLDFGCKNGFVWAVNNAIKQGVTIIRGGNRPLRTACAFGHFDVVKILLDNGADIHADSEFPLRSAAFIENKKLVDYLISRGADLKKAMEYNAITPEDRKVDQFLEEYSKKLN